MQSVSLFTLAGRHPALSQPMAATPSVLKRTEMFSLVIVVMLALVLVMMMVLVVMLALMMMASGRTGGQSERGGFASGRWRKRGMCCLIRNLHQQVSWLEAQIMRSAKWIFYLSSFVNLPVIIAHPQMPLWELLDFQSTSFGFASSTNPG